MSSSSYEIKDGEGNSEAWRYKIRLSEIKIFTLPPLGIIIVEELHLNTINENKEH